MRTTANITLCLLVGCRSAGGGSPPPTAHTQYLTFQLFTHNGSLIELANGGPVGAPPAPTFRPTRAAMSGWLADLVDAIGSSTAERRLAYAIGPINLDMSDETVRGLIADAFDLAVQHDVALAVHIDDSMFWLSQSNLWSDPQNVEWTDWNGTPNAGRSLNWGVEAKLAPQMCFNSPVIIDAIRRFAGVIGGQIAAEVAKLKQSGKEYLFAGAIAGWETHIDREYLTHTRLGYCALTNLGFSADHPPADPDAELEKVVHGFIELWADALRDAGVDPRRTFSHTAFISEKDYEFFKSQGLTGSYSETNGFAPPWVGFSAHFNPGYSIYGGIHDDIQALLDQYGGRPWAESEGTNQIPSMSWETYLAKIYNHGGVLANLFGWGLETDTISAPTRSGEALAVYQKFLRGEALRE